MVSVSEDDGRLKRRKKFLEPDYVWCDTHGQIHARNLHYYGDGDPCDANYRGGESPYRRVYVERLKGDWPHES